MDWYRMKTILIFLFLAINLFLLALLGYESLAEHKTETLRTNTAIKALEKNGISFSAEVAKKHRRLRSLTLENPYADKTAFANNLLGEGTVETDTGFEKDGKVLRFTEKGFSYENTSVPTAAEKKHIAPMKKTLEAIGLSMRYATGHIEGNAVIFTQNIENAPLFACRLCVIPGEDGSISKIEGTWANILNLTGEKQRTSGAAQALLAFLQEGRFTGETVTHVECGYAVLLSADGYRTADAVPAWCIGTQSGKEAYYDARQ